MENVNEIMSPVESFLEALREPQENVATSLASAIADWPCIKPIVLSAIREMLPVVPESSIRAIVIFTLRLYHEPYARHFFVLAHQQRLAMFLRVLIDNMQVPEYSAHFVKQYDLDPKTPNKTALRGLTLVAITSQHVKKMLAKNDDGMFAFELYFASVLMDTETIS